MSLVLLAYYIAAVNIEEAFRGRHGEDSGYEPFNGIVLTDTFNLNKAEDPDPFPQRMATGQQRTRRASTEASNPSHRRQPPHGRQDSRAQIDDNPNVGYPELEDRISRNLCRVFYSNAEEEPLRHIQDGNPMDIRQN